MIESEEFAMPNYPVMFTLKDAVSGNNFLASITLTGRALMQRDDEGKWWMFGVRPGAIAESGTTPEECFLRFRAAYKNLLFDFAEEASDFAIFRRSVEDFYNQPDADEQNEWLAAFNALRSGKAIPEEPFFAKLPKEDPEKRPTQLTVDRLDMGKLRHMPADNVPDYVAGPQLAKAA
jgi:predicted RNase H-like HicB family nuclease